MSLHYFFLFECLVTVKAATSKKNQMHSFLGINLKYTVRTFKLAIWPCDVQCSESDVIQLGRNDMSL